LEQSLKQRAAELGVADRLLFVGRQPPQAVARWMQAANVVCLSSHNEGVPNVVLEAVSCGRPMVSTAVGGIAEIIEPLMSRRFLVPSRDPAAYAMVLTEALDDPPDERELHQKALYYSWENCAQAYLTLMR
jgi:glycosyltransferase involved in cell wall biosynthesis